MAKFLISPKFHSSDPVYSLIGFGGHDNNCQIWTYHNTSETKNIFPKGLVAKHDPRVSEESSDLWIPYL